MVSTELAEVMRRAEQLSPEDQQQLLAYLLDRTRAQDRPLARERKWSDIRGSVPYPALGEDAQAWVSRTRREADESRAAAWENSRENSP